jgi:hypothetical protein
MHSFQHSRVRILFDVACAFGISASCVWAWMQTYASAFLPAAAITALYGLVHAFDMIRRRPGVERVVEPAETAPVVEQLAPAAMPAEVIPDTKPKRKPARQSRKTEPESIETTGEAEPVVAETAVEAEPEVPELKPAMHVVDTAPDEPEYYPATPLFEPEPFLRQQRAAFGRKAR